MIVLGAGPVGIGAVLELARFGVPTVAGREARRNLVATSNTRTMRSPGVGCPQRTSGSGALTRPMRGSPIRFLRPAIGEQLGMIELKGFEGPGPDVSPAVPIMSCQRLIEQILQDAVRAWVWSSSTSRLAQRGSSEAAAPRTTAWSSRCGTATPSRWVAVGRGRRRVAPHPFGVRSRARRPAGSTSSTAISGRTSSA